jgi:MraZ protein
LRPPPLPNRSLTLPAATPHLRRGWGLYQGLSKLTLDAKGRISVPARHRDALIAQCEGRVTLTRHPDGCLLLYPRSRWEQKREELSRLPYAARVLQRILVGSAVDLELDSVGRILVSPELRSAAGLERDVFLSGVGEHFELWEPARMEDLEQKHLAEGGVAAAGDFAV